MGRPLSWKGEIMGDHIEITEFALAAAEQELIDELKNLTIEPTEWAACAGRVLSELRKARIATLQMRQIFDDNNKKNNV